MKLNISTTSVPSNATEIFGVEEKHQPYQEKYWIASETAIVIAILINLYYLICLIPYALSLKKESKIKKLLVYLTLLSVVLALGRFVSDQMVAFLGWQSDDYCLHSVSVSFLLYPFSVGVVYSVLWLKQNNLYSQLYPANEKKLKYASIGSLLIIVASSTILAILWQIPSVTGWSYKATETGCRDANDVQDLEPLPLILSSVSLVGQLSLLGLFIYPLIISKKPRKEIRVTASNWDKTLNWWISKVCVLTTICVISDILTTVIQLMWVQPELVYLAIYDVNLNVNITCIILSFNDDCKEIFTALWKLRFSREEEPHARTTQGSTTGKCAYTSSL